MVLRLRVDFSKLIVDSRYKEAFGSLRSASAAVAGVCIQQPLVEMLRMMPDDADSRRSGFLQLLTEVCKNTAQFSSSPTGDHNISH
jgi:hypothetical protein